MCLSQMRDLSGPLHNFPDRTARRRAIIVVRSGAPGTAGRCSFGNLAGNKLCRNIEK
jgi:hypothetical protein